MNTERISFRLPEGLCNTLDSIADDIGIYRSDLMRMVLIDWMVSSFGLSDKVKEKMWEETFPEFREYMENKEPGSRYYHESEENPSEED